MPIHDWTRADAGAFHHLHLSWIAQLSAVLNQGLLPPQYYALAEARAGETEPDVLTLKLRETMSFEPESPPGPARQGPPGAIALAEAPPQVEIVTDLDTDFYVRRRRTLVIRHASDHRIVALIEVVSPGNKSSQHAFDQFLEKIFSALDQGINVVLIDLHPPTLRDPRGLHAVITEAYGREIAGLGAAKNLTLASYLAGSERRAFAQPVAVGDHLTPMPLFLEDAYYIQLPLEETYMAAWNSIPRHIQQSLT
ncbi:MAG TPA: DUF4058 family protein [Pirellulaceae bacterium]|nr:DUF4058 family protein [Pirellulaceae bacterium]